MPNRLNRRNLDARIRNLQQSLRRPLVVTLSSTLFVAMAGNLVAEDQLQLHPPMNSTLTIRNAETNWSKRPETTIGAEAATPDNAAAETLPPATDPAVAESSRAENNDVSEKKTVPALPASGPLDRFRGPKVSLPSMRLGNPLAKPDAESDPNGIPTPGERALEQMQAPTAVPPGAWQGRPASTRTVVSPDAPTTDAAPTAEGVFVTDDFRAPAREGNWVARDAVNRIAPLTDPAPASQRSRQITPAAPQTRSLDDTPNAFDILKKPAPSAADSADLTDDPIEALPPLNDAGAQPVANPAAIEVSPVAEPAPGTQSIGAENGVAEPDTPTISVPPRDDKAIGGAETPSAELSQPEASQGRAQDAISGVDDAALAVEPSSMEPSELSQLQQETSGADEQDASNHQDEPIQQDEPELQDEPEQEDEVDIADKMLQSLDGPSPKVVRRSVGDLSSTSETDEGQEIRSKRVVKRTPSDPSPRVQSLSDSARQVAKPSADAAASVGDLKPATHQYLDYTGRPADPIEVGRYAAGMRTGIERTLNYFYARPEIANGRSNWGMMHSMMVFGADTQLIVGRQKYSTIAWIAGNNNCRGQRLLTRDNKGIQAKTGVGLQGHQGQFLAVLGMCDVPSNYPLHAGGAKYDVAALIEAEKRGCKSGEELTFTLIGLSHYLDTDSSWIADDGTRWDFERLIEEELKQPIVGAACGGTHRLMGYAHALRKRRAEGKPITGQWKRAEIYTQDFIDYAYSLQNRDGSMSTEWFEGRGDKNDVDRKVQTTGHIVEWLLTVTPDDQLQDRRLTAAVSFLLRSIGSDLKHDWSIGPKGHALRSLAMYHQRVFRSGTPWIPSSVARSGNTNRQSR